MLLFSVVKFDVCFLYGCFWLDDDCSFCFGIVVGSIVEMDVPGIMEEWVDEGL